MKKIDLGLLGVSAVSAVIDLNRTWGIDGGNSEAWGESDLISQVGYGIIRGLSQ